MQTPPALALENATALVWLVMFLERPNVPDAEADSISPVPELAPSVPVAKEKQKIPPF